MTDPVFLVLRICLLALVYLVFLRVLRAVWVELRTESRVVVAPPVMVPAGDVPATARTDAPARPVGPRLVVLAPAALAGRVYDLADETTIGRAPGCGVVVDDGRVSKLHARVFHTGGRWMVEDLGSTNGTLLDEQVLDRPRMIGPGARIQVGEHVLEVV